MPLPLNISLMIYAVTRKRTIIDALFRLGICVSYNRVLQLTSDIGNGVCEWFVRDGLVCPPKMHSGLFTTAAVDNIDYNPSYATFMALESRSCNILRMILQDMIVVWLSLTKLLLPLNQWLLCLPCQDPESCDTTCCKQCSVAIVSGERTFYSNDQTFHDNCQRSCSTPSPWSKTCSCC